MTQINQLLRLVRIVSSAAIIFSLTTAALAAASPTEVKSPSTTDKNHHLFVGPDLFITHESESVAIRKISNKEALIDTPSHHRVALGKAPHFRLKMAPKVSSNSASITKLETEETYSAGTDPAMIAMMDQLDQARTQGIIANQVHNAEQALSTGGIRVDFAGTATSFSSTGNQTDGGEDTPDETSDIASGLLDDALARQEIVTNALDFGGSEDEIPDYNAIRISFEVSSEKPMADAYAVILVNIEIDGEVSRFTTYKRIGEMDQKPRRVKIYHEGFPPGYTIKDTQIFVFNHGEEVATNFSDKHYDITTSQAREFVKLNHRGLHRRDTVPAEPAWSLAPPVLQATQTSEDYDYSVTVELDSAGDLVSIDTAGQTIPEHVQAVLRETTFVPALEKGKPIATTLVVNPADFFKE